MEKMIFKLRKIGDAINEVSRASLAIITLALCVAVIGQLFARWFSFTLSWASEFACLIFVWQTMLGSAVASRHLLHIGVDMLVNALHGKVKKAMLIIANVVLLIGLGIFTYSSAVYTLGQIDHFATSFHMSLAWFYASLPISGIIMIFYTVIQMLEVIHYGDVVRIPLPGTEE